MKPRSFEAADGTICWNRQSLILAGYVSTGITCRESEVTWSRQQDICRRLDRAPEGVRCIRIGVDLWEYFLNSGKAGPYVERPLLGF